MNRRCGVLLAAVLAATIVVPAGTRAAAQSAGDVPVPGRADPGSVLDYAGNVFNPASGSFEFDVDRRDVQGVDKSVSDVHFAGQYTATPCPDARGTAKASITVTVGLSASGVGVLESYQVELPIEIDVNDNAVYTKVRFAGRYFDKMRNRRGNLEDSVTRLQYAGTARSAKAVVDNEGPFNKAVLQKKADVVEQHAQALANRVATKLQAVWQDGKSCVTLSATPGSKTVQPRATFPVAVTATAKDGAAIKRRITAALDGPTSVKPKASKSAPATFTYVAPATKGQKGHIAFAQRSKRGIGRTEVEYKLSEKWKFDLTAVKELTPGGEQHIACYDVRCGTGAGLTGLSVTMELGDDGHGVAPGPAVLRVSSTNYISSTCSADSSVPVTMVVTVDTVGDTRTVSAKSSPDPTYQFCNGAAFATGPVDQTTSIFIPAVSVPAAGGSGSTTADSDFCLNLAADNASYRCTFTVTATKVED